jgi:hypothetical protein
MAYIKLIDGVPTPYNVAQLRREGVSLRRDFPPERLASLGVFPLVDSPATAPSRPGRVVEQSGFVWVKTGTKAGQGFYTQNWIERSQTPAEVEADRASLVEKIKAEAGRRILAFLPEHKQRNLTAQGVLLLKKGTLTAEEQAVWDAGEAAWMHVAAIRAASDRLEAMDPVPLDFEDDAHWP